MNVPVLCDLDGVVWLKHEPLPGAVRAIADLRSRGHRVLFVTNNSSKTLGDQVAILESLGIAARGDVCTSAQAAALMLRSGDRVLVAGGPGVREAVESVGAVVAATTDDDVDDATFAADVADVAAVVVGYHSSFDYRGMTRAAVAVRAGARLIGTNEDPTYPTPNGPIPGGGAILAAIAVAAGTNPVVAGKPHAPMGELVKRTLGVSDLSHAWMVGDRNTTDGGFARTIGSRYAMIRSGTEEPDPHEPPDVVCASLAEFAEYLLRQH
jgi:glycerol 3-phosphatase-2